MSYQRRVIAGTTNTGDAAAGDVAAGKVFSSSALTNATGTSTKNATVPADAPIRPGQMLVDNIGKLNGMNSYFDFSGQPITKFVVGTSTADPIFGALYASFIISGAGFTLDLRWCDLAEVDQILADVWGLTVGFTIPGVAVKLDGGTNAEPTPVVPHIAGETIVALSAALAIQEGTPGCTISVSNDGPSLTINVDASIALADSSLSSFEPAGTLQLGVLDSPSLSDLNSKLIELLNDQTGYTANLDGDAVLVSFVTDAFLPISVSNLTEIAMITLNDPGQAFVPNADLTNIVDAGGSVTSN